MFAGHPCRSKNLVVWGCVSVFRMNRECLKSSLNSYQGGKLPKLERFSFGEWL